MSGESVSSDRPDEPDPKDEGDEAIISMSIAGEVTDSSIVEMGKSRPQFQYSREELMVIKNLPMAKRRPECLDAFQKNARPPWESERWHSDRKRSETPPEDDHQQQQQQRPLSIRDRDQQQQQNDPQNKRRSGDPRERIRKEQDGIVLSPQRRSFNTGCFVNVTQPITRRPESPIGKTEVPHREPVRRIGSGRLLTRDMWDFRPETDKIDSERPDYSAYRSSNNSTREINREPMRERDNIRDRDDRYERRSFGRDFGNDRENRDRNNDNRHPMDRDKDRRDRRYGGGGGGSNERRRNYEPKEPEEPEWFSGGPISQHDTIELRGFDDIPEEKTPPKNNLNNNNNSNNSNNNNNNMKKTSPAQKKRGKKIINERDDKINDGNSAGPKGRSTPTSSFDQNNSQTHESHSLIDDKNDETSANGAVHTDLDDTLNNESNDTNDKSDVTKNRDDQQQQQPQMNFNLDDFLKSDNLPGVSGLLANGVGAGSGSSSRFSQWFKRESPIDQDGLSINDELLNNLLNDITEPNIQVPSVTESNTYFAPISPANQTGNNTQPGNGTKLLEMLQRGSKPNQNGQDNHPDASMPMMKNNIKDMEVGGKMMHSLEELEARMRGGMTQASQIEPPRVNKNDDEMLAFKKLLAQVSGGQAVPAAVQSKPAQPMTLMQLLKSQQAQQHIHAPLQHQQPPPQHEQQPPPHQQQFNHHGPLGPAQHPHQAQMQHENLMKVLRIQQQQQQQQQQREQQQQKQRQQQNDMLSMMIAGQRMTGASPIPPELHMLANNVPSSRELLQRPEAQAIIQGLQQGEITIQHLIQQLQNPAMQPRHREVLGNILKTYGPTTPRTVSPHQGPGVPHEQMMQQLLFQQQQQQQQQQRVPSPMNNVMPHRVPSPRDLVMHTQSIMQNALIKTKLEEQRENYRKRQEQQQQQQQHHHHHHQQQQMHQQRITSPMNNSPSKQMMSPTPLTFTPTSVLRKMTAEKEPDGAIFHNYQVDFTRTFFTPRNRYHYKRPNQHVTNNEHKFNKNSQIAKNCDDNILEKKKPVFETKIVSVVDQQVDNNNKIDSVIDKENLGGGKMNLIKKKINSLDHSKSVIHGEIFTSFCDDNDKKFTLDTVPEVDEEDKGISLATSDSLVSN